MNICPTTCNQFIPRGCARCNTPMGTPFMLPPPFGTLNSSLAYEVCGSCYIDYARLGWIWLGQGDPGPDLMADSGIRPGSADPAGPHLKIVTP